MPPEEGWFKLNVDDSLRAVDYLVGPGAVVKDSNRLFMAGLSGKLISSISIEMAEASAILNGLHLAIESAFSRLIVESGALSIIKYLSSPIAPHSEVGLIIADIIALSSRATVKFSFVPRIANSVAHSLARFSFSISNICIWLEDAPS
ncbi:hypothetical protein ACOSQ2_025095 [Xanthoceras sorbifolium]